ncbi:MAG TPA: phosphatidate cytidylyltransferase [Chloroflexi bacterium]|nr:phosphatidate cytidylyltransferase [Chloroflexota bacterium]HBY06728.1 phosphatidate cytidylyltransferase [Chloroflexota bacterium]
MRSQTLLRQRVLVALVLLPIGLILIYLGGWAFAAIVALILALAAWEYTRLFQAGNFQPSYVIVIGGTLLITAGRYFDGFASTPWIISLIVLAGMTWHLVAYERGRDQAATDFAISISGAFYIGWLGAYLISLRELPNGLWWILVALPAVWLADSGAYFIGRAIGKHKLSPRLSPKKTWEGYLGGLIFGTIGSVLLVLLWSLIEPGIILPWQGAVLGLLISAITPLGDLGESMIKRQFGIKDSSHLIPGHGGAFDRIDSWLWAGVLGYYIIQWLFL